VEIVKFLDELLGTLDKDNWEPTDTGFQLTTRNFVVKLRKSDRSNIELEVEDYKGNEIAKVLQKLGSEGADDMLSLKLSFLYQNLERKPIDRIAALDDVIRELRTGRGGS
jgi:hypothetical protein